YLLSSQGDRMMAANSVEGRFPFLDHRVVEFCSRLPVRFKIRGLQEKHVLKRSAQGLLPPQIWQRRKRPYRAPIHPAFFPSPSSPPVGGKEGGDYVNTLLSPDAIKASDIFNPKAVARLARKCQAGGRVSEGDGMALVGILSTQLLHHLFVDNFPPQPVEAAHPVRVCRGQPKKHKEQY
ncbi:MAG: asparagine synthase-related protein, partial [Chloroflexota bacterium]|nr:asparagine synthase-related protein [Chloroflexota bacterium]